MGHYWWQTGSSSRGSGRRRKPASPTPESALTFQLRTPEEAEGAVESYRAGDLCPNCGFTHLEYDGYFNVYCPICGFRTGARGACT
ncbi:hypothetical protein [Thermoflexus sp.]|uniref:hypothetical protein n=1 Tax=Thermoflexus sp. TaxID=1969742 RepID=UPI0035E43B28